MFGSARNGLAVGDLRSLQLDIDSEQALQFLHCDPDVKFSHPGEKELASGGFSTQVECRIFLHESAERGVNFILIPL